MDVFITQCIIIGITVLLLNRLTDGSDSVPPAVLYDAILTSVGGFRRAGAAV